MYKGGTVLKSEALAAQRVSVRATILQHPQIAAFLLPTELYESAWILVWLSQNPNAESNFWSLHVKIIYL